MAPRRSFRKKRTVRRRKASSPTAAGIVQAIKGFALLKLKQKLGLNTETHWQDSTETTVATSNTCLSMVYPYSIPVDDTVNGRTGNTVRCISYTVTGRIQANTAATTGCLVRIFFVKFKDVRGRLGSLDATDFLDSTTRITTKYNMGDNVDAIGYTVLYDRTFKISVNGQDNDTQPFHFEYKALNYHLKWQASDTTGAIGNLMSDAVRGFIMTSETGANTPNYWADHRVRFVDN